MMKAKEKGSLVINSNETILSIEETLIQLLFI